MSTSDSIEINIWLKDTYGCELDGRPRWRTTWTTGQLEKRFGEFTDYYGPIFLRKVKAMREVPKYPFDKDRWVLEKLEYNNNPELAERFSYEPVYIFKDSKDKFLPLKRKVVEFILGAFYNRERTTPQKEEDAQLRADAEELEYFRNKIGEGQRPFSAIEIVE